MRDYELTSNTSTTDNRGEAFDLEWKIPPSGLLPPPTNRLVGLPGLLDMAICVNYISLKDSNCMKKNHH